VRERKRRIGPTHWKIGWVLKLNKVYFHFALWYNWSMAKGVTLKLKDRIWQRDRGLCFYCGKHLNKKHPERTLDHVIPKCSPDSSNRMWNLVLACKPCNSEKAASDPTPEQIAVIMERKEWSEAHFTICKAIRRASRAGAKDEVQALIKLREAIWSTMHRYSN